MVFVLFLPSCCIPNSRGYWYSIDHNMLNILLGWKLQKGLSEMEQTPWWEAESCSWLQKSATACLSLRTGICAVLLHVLWFCKYFFTTTGVTKAWKCSPAGVCIFPHCALCCFVYRTGHAFSFIAETNSLLGSQSHYRYYSTSQKSSIVLSPYLPSKKGKLGFVRSLFHLKHSWSSRLIFMKLCMNTVPLKDTRTTNVSFSCTQ